VLKVRNISKQIPFCVPFESINNENENDFEHFIIFCECMKTSFSPVERTVLFCTIVLKVSKQLQIAFKAAFLQKLEEDICSRDSCACSDDEIHGPSNSLIQ